MVPTLAVCPVMARGRRGLPLDDLRACARDALHVIVAHDLDALEQKIIETEPAS
jgi:hypothetical protein